MKKLVLIFAFAVSVSLIFAQGSKQDLTSIRKEKRKAEIEKKYQLTRDMLQNKNFVVESDFLENRYGFRIPVSPNINFVKVEPNNEAVIQIGSNWGVGPNGVGGITAKGKITKWQVTENQKNKTFYVKMFVLTPIGMYDLNLSVMAGGQTRARLTGNYSGHLTFDGDLVPVDQSAVYEGWSI